MGLYFSVDHIAKPLMKILMWSTEVKY